MLYLIVFSFSHVLFLTILSYVNKVGCSVVVVVVAVVVLNETTAGKSTIRANHVRSLQVVCLPALLLCHELQLGMAGHARGKFVADLLRLWHKMVNALSSLHGCLVLSAQDGKFINS